MFTAFILFTHTPLRACGAWVLFGPGSHIISVLDCLGFPQLPVLPRGETLPRMRTTVGDHELEDSPWAQK